MRGIRWVLDYLPRGAMLDAEVFRARHRTLCWILALHIPGLFVFGVWRGYGAAHSATEVAVPAACLLLAVWARRRRVASFFSTLGLVFCSYVLVHLSEGSIEAHFHFFVLIGLIALYQDWIPFMFMTGFTVLSHGIGGATDPDSMYNHYAGQNKPWLWAGIHGVGVLAASVGLIVFWKNTEREQQRNTALTQSLAAAQLETVQAEASARRSTSELLVNLARRNQSLLDRQLELISDLEQRSREPQGLSELFQLDHLATRIRRNAESLLVLSGDEAPRRWGRPVPLGEVVRAAAAEVEDYRRVDVLVDEHLEVAGRVVADLAHLLAELIENATVFSPPTTEVRVRSHLVPVEWTTATFVLSVEDRGVGMSVADLQEANQLLAEPTEIDLTRSRLGFHVVSRLGRRHGLRVRLVGTPGGGVTALVTLPESVVGERSAVPVGALAVNGTSPTPAMHLPDTATTAPELLDFDAAPVTATATALDPRPFIQASRRLRLPDDDPPGYANPSSLPPPPPPPPPPLPEGGTPLDIPAPLDRPLPPPPPPPAPTEGDGNGLQRRVPGAALAPSLRRSADQPADVPGHASDGFPPGFAADRQRVGSMLSRFQSSRRAGMVAADANSATDPNGQDEPDDPGVEEP